MDKLKEENDTMGGTLFDSAVISYREPFSANHSRLALFSVVSLTVAISLGIGCNSRSEISYEEISSGLEECCAHCHDSSNGTAIQLAEEIKKADLLAAHPEEVWRSWLPETALKSSTNTLEGDWGSPVPADRMVNARLVHLLGILHLHLVDLFPPDFAHANTFEAYAYKKPCIALERLEAGEKRLGNGMPPLWAAPLMEILGRPYRGIAPEEAFRLGLYLEARLGDASPVDCRPAAPGVGDDLR